MDPVRAFAPALAAGHRDLASRKGRRDRDRPETVLVFPRQGQTCHAYCSYCFRWAQFVDEPELKMATADLDRVVGYLRQHREVTSVLITGGDPMIMSAAVLRRYLEPLLEKPFFARYDPDATWLTDLRPAFATCFPFEAADPEDLPGLRSPELFESAS